MTELFEKSIRVLELPQLLERLSQKAVSEAAKERALRLTPSTDADDVMKDFEAWHIQGKDGIYAAALLVEAIAKTGRRLSALWDEITQKYGAAEMAEHDFHFSSAERTRIFKLLMEDKQLPEFPCEIAKVSYMDGCKVYFTDGSWVICRFSGTEPLLRVFCEMDTMENAEKIAKILTEFLSL